MQIERRVGPNCFGFVLSELGLCEDGYVEAYQYDKFLENYGFEETGIDDAKVVAILYTPLPLSGGDVVVGHVALINADKQTATHRPGINKPISSKDLDKLVSGYRDFFGEPSDYKYLKLKS